MGQEMNTTIYLDTVGEAKGRHIAFSDGGWPYLWIGDNRLCYGCIPDNKVRALRDMCNAIIKTREKPKKKGGQSEETENQG